LASHIHAIHDTSLVIEVRTLDHERMEMGDGEVLAGLWFWFFLHGILEAANYCLLDRRNVPIGNHDKGILIDTLQKVRIAHARDGGNSFLPFVHFKENVVVCLRFADPPRGIDHFATPCIKCRRVFI
jgi:hypothetical protein